MHMCTTKCYLQTSLVTTGTNSPSLVNDCLCRLICEPLLQTLHLPLIRNSYHDPGLTDTHGTRVHRKWMKQQVVFILVQVASSHTDRPYITGSLVLGHKLVAV